MVAAHGSNAEIFGNGYNLTDYLNSASFGGERESAETTTFGKQSKTYIPGLKDTTLSVEGIWDGDVDAVDQILSAALDTTVTGLFSYCPNGDNAVGRIAYTMDAIESSYEVNTEVGDVAQISAELAAGDKGNFSRGIVISPMNVKGAGGNGTSFDGGAASTNGAGLVVHSLASGTLVVKLQDSADNSTFADVAGASVSISTGRASARVTVSGTLRRYVRALWTGTGTFTAICERY